MTDTIIIDVYHPLVAGDHDATCAALCTDYNARTNRDGCSERHGCWCPDGALSYADFTAKHPDCSVAEA